jgi:ERCC4-type nuclease
VVETREQNPFDFSRFQGWFSGVERRALKLGDYSISGLEDVCVVERKNLSDLVRSFTVERSGFVARLRQMAEYPHRLLVGHGSFKPSQVALPSLRGQSQPHYAIVDCRACRPASTVCLH